MVIQRLMDIRPARHSDEVSDAASLALELVETNQQRYSDNQELIDDLYRDSWFYEDPPYIPEGFCPPKGDVLVAYVENIPVGTVAFCPLSGGYCELKWMYVSERWRGSGVATALCNELINMARILGYEGIRLHTGERQPEAHRLYLKLGFEEVPGWEDLPLEGVKFFELQIRLS